MVTTVVIEEVSEVLKQPDEDHVREACNDVVADGVVDVVVEENVNVDMVNNLVSGDGDAMAEEITSRDALVQQGDIATIIIVMVHAVSIPKTACTMSIRYSAYQTGGACIR